MTLALGNRITNGGFETALWAPWNGVNASVSSRYSHAGTYAAQLDGGDGNAYVQQTVPAAPGETFEQRLSLAKDGTATSAPVVISVLFYTADHIYLQPGLIVYVPGADIPPALPRGWYDFRGSTEPAPAATAWALVIVNKLPQPGSPDLWVDEVQLLPTSIHFPFGSSSTDGQLNSSGIRVKATPQTAEQPATPRGRFASGGASLPSIQNTPFAYVTSSYDNLVSVFSTATSAMVRKIPVGCAPSGLALIPRLHKVYVANLLDNTVSVIDTTRHHIVRTIQVGWEPAYLAAAPDGSRVYVSNASDDTVSVIDTAADVVIDPPIPVGSTPHGIIVSPDSRRIYVASATAGIITVIDAAAKQAVAAVTDVGNAKKIALSPDGTRLYVAGDGGRDGITIIETAGHTITGTMPIGAGAEALLLSPDGTLCYAAIASENAVGVIDIATQTTRHKIGVGVAPGEMAGSPDGSRIYVTNFSGDSVSVIDTSENKVTATIPVGSSPSAIAIHA
ncbi:Virginiamycin B lyase [Paenibacillus solanacearum]|uniref:Virginiamycin B lyase n=1 Tax=Paenibacillus solanacearum TaxID=2048548 RepID=A0A916K817_9BACL|nr:NTTRR-F1 domain [Paenibacillus solanacearum]CAG7643835.1 Virginiamycin B lyase [Paenibacillus solanacearum]